MQASADINDRLMQEVNHRVKNNLQVVSSLLSLQLELAGEKSSTEIIQSSQQRIDSLSLLHEQLYNSNDGNSIDIKSYLEGIALNLFRPYKKNGEVKILKCKIQNENFQLDTLIPLGLIANELISNNLKHGHSSDQTSLIEILGESLGDYYQLSFKDNGKGFDFHETLLPLSLGLKLVNGLVNQIGGKITHKNSNGSLFSITFPIKVRTENRK